MTRPAYNCHEIPPEQLFTIQGLRSHLCTVAYHGRELHPEECAKCRSCGYGKRLLQLLEREGEDYSHIKPIKDDDLPTIRALLTANDYHLTLKQIVRQRKKAPPK